jgi:multiple sugar transport system substrate-binding protein
MPGPRWEGALRASAEAYKTVNPEATVNILVNPFTEHYQKIGTELASDSDATDVYVFDAALLGQSQAKLLPLTDLIASDAAWKSFYEEGVPAAYRDSWSWDGVPLAVVHDANCMMAWQRTDISEQNGLPAPTTFEIMLDNANKLNAVKKNSGFMTTAAAGAYLAVLYTGMMHAFGGKWWENDIPDAFGRISAEKPPGAVLLDSPENVAAMTMLRDLVAAGPEASLNAQEFENNEAFKNDLVYQQLMWSGLMVLQTEKENPQYWDKLASSPFPTGGSNTDANAAGIKGGFGLSIPKASKNAELAFDFSKFVASAENAETFIGGGGQPPNTATLTEWSTKPGFQVFETLATGIISGHHQAQFPEGGEFYDTISNATAAVLTGEKEPADGCADMKKNTEALLKRAGYV